MQGLQQDLFASDFGGIQVAAKCFFEDGGELGVFILHLNAPIGTEQPGTIGEGISGLLFQLA
ncbi:MAG TPA: hypothetical protein VN040_20350 [Pseudosphingobacterium sp.]|nr:hypothetical protein [Pseudosphingobacterium sp.]